MDRVDGLEPLVCALDHGARPSDAWERVWGDYDDPLVEAWKRSRDVALMRSVLRWAGVPTHDDARDAFALRARVAKPPPLDARQVRFDWRLDSATSLARCERRRFNRRTTMPALHAPRTDLPVDLEAHIAKLPPDASCKGFFFTDIINRLKRAHPSKDPYALAGIPDKRYVPFFEYPYADILRLCFNGAKHLHPDLPIGAALRELGSHAYDTLLKSPAGRVIAGVFGLDIEQLLPNGIKAYGVALNFGTVTIEMVGSRTARYEFRDLPGLLETYQVGVIEGAVKHCGCEPEMLVSVPDIANASMELRWR